MAGCRVEYKAVQVQESQDPCDHWRLLATPQREVICLDYLRGLTHLEIAKRLGVPLGTIKTRTQRGLLQLRRLLNKIDGLGDAA